MHCSAPDRLAKVATKLECGRFFMFPGCPLATLQVPLGVALSAG